MGLCVLSGHFQSCKVKIFAAWLLCLALGEYSFAPTTPLFFFYVQRCYLHEMFRVSAYLLLILVGQLQAAICMHTMGLLEGLVRVAPDASVNCFLAIGWFGHATPRL